jgi:hypothetical protein
MECLAGDAEELGVSTEESTATCNTPQHFLVALKLQKSLVFSYTETYFKHKTAANLPLVLAIVRYYFPKLNYSF